jgi:hypothetical protein
MLVRTHSQLCKSFWHVRGREPSHIRLICVRREGEEKEEKGIEKGDGEVDGEREGEKGEKGIEKGDVRSCNSRKTRKVLFFFFFSYANLDLVFCVFVAGYNREFLVFF